MRMYNNNLVISVSLYRTTKKEKECPITKFSNESIHYLMKLNVPFYHLVHYATIQVGKIYIENPCIQ